MWKHKRPQVDKRIFRKKREQLEVDSSPVSGTTELSSKTTQKQTPRSVEQHGGARCKGKQLQPEFLTRLQCYTMEKRVFLTRDRSQILISCQPQKIISKWIQDSETNGEENISRHWRGAGEVAQWLRMLAVPPKDWSLVPSGHCGVSHVTPPPGDSNSSSSLLRCLHTGVHVHICKVK